MKIKSKFELMNGQEVYKFLNDKIKKRGGNRFNEVLISSPYFSQNGKNILLKKLLPKKRGYKLQLLIRKDMEAMAMGSIHSDSVKELINPKHELCWNPNLHAKIYLFQPGNIAIIGSSNLSGGGFSSINQELNVVWSGSKKVFDAVKSQFDNLWKKSEKITKNSLRSQILLSKEFPEFKNLIEAKKIIGNRFWRTYPYFSERDDLVVPFEMFKKICVEKLPEEWKQLVKWYKNNCHKETQEKSIKQLFLFLEKKGIFQLTTRNKIISVKLTNVGKRV